MYILSGGKGLYICDDDLAGIMHIVSLIFMVFVFLVISIHLLFMFLVESKYKMKEASIVEFL